MEAIDIVDVVGERVALKRQGREYLGLCPFHPDHKPSLAVSPQKRIFKCWSCGAGGDALRFVQMIEHISFPEAIQLLAKRLGFETHATPADRRAASQRDEIQQAVRWAKQRFQENLAADAVGRQAREYVQRRGLSEETVRRFSLGLALDSWDDVLAAARRAGLRDEILEKAGLIARNDAGRIYDRFRNRLIFPIHDSLGRPIAFGGRTLGDDSAKYLNSPETVLFNKSRVLFGMDVARKDIGERKSAIVVEGYMDAVLLHQAGFTNAVATLGTSLTDAHVKLLHRIADTIYLCFDGDDAGLRAATRAVETTLRSQADVRVTLMDPGTDPADTVLARGAEGFQVFLHRSVDALEFKWTQTLNAFEQAGARGRRIAAEEFLQFVAGVTVAGGVDRLQENLLVQRLSELLGVSADEVFTLLATAKRTARRTASADSGRTAVTSSYEQSIRGLPAAIVTAMESVFGLLVVDSGCWHRVDDAVAQAAGHSQTWSSLYRILLDVHEELGEYSLGDVLSRCDDSDVCELVSRARARVVGSSDPVQDFDAACHRLAGELSVMQWGELQAEIHGADLDKFEALRRGVPRVESPIPLSGRLNTQPSSG